ncbi:MAG: hypothetical protein AAF127_16750 [Pseudomonadota bacterium]
MRAEAILVVVSLALTACSSGPDRSGFHGQRSVFHNPYGPIIVTDPTTEHPPYVICGRRNCFLLDKDGNFTRMSGNERRAWRDQLERVELNQEQREWLAAQGVEASELPPLQIPKPPPTRTEDDEG